MSNGLNYLDWRWRRRGNSQQHLGHLMEDHLCDQLPVLLNVFANQRHRAVHHLHTKHKLDTCTFCPLGGSIVSWQHLPSPVMETSSFLSVVTHTVFFSSSLFSHYANCYHTTALAQLKSYFNRISSNPQQALQSFPSDLNLLCSIPLPPLPTISVTIHLLSMYLTCLHVRGWSIRKNKRRRREVPENQR